MNIKTIYVYIYCIITYTICPYSSVVERLPCKQKVRVQVAVGAKFIFIL